MEVRELSQSVFMNKSQWGIAPMSQGNVNALGRLYTFEKKAIHNFNSLINQDVGELMTLAYSEAESRGQMGVLMIQFVYTIQNIGSYGINLNSGGQLEVRELLQSMFTTKSEWGVTLMSQRCSLV